MRCTHALNVMRNKRQKIDFFSSFHVHLFVPPDSCLQLLLNSSLLWCLQVLSWLWICLSLISCPLLLSFHFISSLIFLTLPLSLSLSLSVSLSLFYCLLISLLCLYILTYHLYILNLCIFCSPLSLCVSVGTGWLLTVASVQQVINPSSISCTQDTGVPQQAAMTRACALPLWCMRSVMFKPPSLLLSCTCIFNTVPSISWIATLSYHTFHPIHAVLFGSAFETVKNIHFWKITTIFVQLPTQTADCL